jgi:hypothetical protein
MQRGVLHHGRYWCCMATTMKVCQQPMHVHWLKHMGLQSCALLLVQGTGCVTTREHLRCYLGGSIANGRDSLRNYLV